MSREPEMTTRLRQQVEARLRGDSPTQLYQTLIYVYELAGMGMQNLQRQTPTDPRYRSHWEKWMNLYDKALDALEEMDEAIEHGLPERLRAGLARVSDVILEFEPTNARLLPPGR